MYKANTSLFLVFFVVLSAFGREDSISLKGEWRFEIDRTDKGVAEKWFARELTDRICLPGSMAENGKGDEITLQTKWTGSIYDSSFYFSPRYAKYRQPGNIYIPFWLTPAKHYTGAAWYQKEVNIPANWKGKRIRLYLERAPLETRVWVDDQEIGLRNSLVAAHEYEISSHVTPGVHRISVRVDNRIKEINVGPDSHSISDHTQGNWNGIVGRLSLHAEPLVYFDDIQVFPDLTNRKARIRVSVRNEGTASVAGKISVFAKSFNTPVRDQTGVVTAPFSAPGQASDTLEIDLPFSKNIQTWDEFNPALYKLTATLRTGPITHSQSVQLGMREFTIEKNHFLINGRPVFLRGTLHNCEFPLTGYPATTTKAWERIFRIAKAHGLNHIRFHSWCPPEAAFVAADIVGMYLQPEGPSWPNHGPRIGLGQAVDSFLFEETRRMTRNYGNYASFVMLSAGNEPAGDQVRYLNTFVNYWKNRDQRRVYTGMSVGGSWPVVPDAQYQVRGGVRGLSWDRRPESQSDFSSGIVKFEVPFVAHEIGQYCVFPDFDEIKNYTGVYRAKNFELFRQDLTDQGMGEQARDFLMASGKLQVICYKYEIEKIFRTPGYAGFQLLGLQDFPGQGTALVGVLNAFWKEKGYVTPAAYQRFCNSTVPLAALPRFVFTNDETFSAQILVAHWGAAPLTNPRFWWILKTDDGQTIGEGILNPGRISIGNGQPVGEINCSLNKMKKAVRVKLEVGISGTPYQNDWYIWVYPKKAPISHPDIYYTSSPDEKAERVLASGGKVFLNIAGKVIKGKEVGMHFLPVFWNTSWFQMKPPHVTGMLIQEKSAAFADFPTSYHSDLQWWDIQHRSQVMILEDFPEGFQPLVQPIDTWFLNRRLGLIYEAKVGKGKIIVSSADLGPQAGSPAAKQLFYSIQNYMSSPGFNPRQEVAIEVIRDVLISPSKQGFQSYTSDSPDELKPGGVQNKTKK